VDDGEFGDQAGELALRGEVKGAHRSRASHMRSCGRT
jgi:hypothetical protein